MTEVGLSPSSLHLCDAAPPFCGSPLAALLRIEQPLAEPLLNLFESMPGQFPQNQEVLTLIFLMTLLLFFLLRATYLFQVYSQLFHHLFEPYHLASLLPPLSFNLCASDVCASSLRDFALPLSFSLES
jgi:hypothetical protein